MFSQPDTPGFVGTDAPLIERLLLLRQGGQKPAGSHKGIPLLNQSSEAPRLSSVSPFSVPAMSMCSDTPHSKRVRAYAQPFLPATPDTEWIPNAYGIHLNKSRANPTRGLHSEFCTACHQRLVTKSEHNLKELPTEPQTPYGWSRSPNNLGKHSNQLQQIPDALSPTWTWTWCHQLRTKSKLF